LPTSRTGKLRLRSHVVALSAKALLLVMVSGLLAIEARSAVEPNSIEVVTQFATQGPPAAGASVCLTGGGGAVGNVKSVRLLPGHELAHDLWQVVIEINNRDAPRITSGSVACAVLDPDCGVEINGGSSGPPIGDHAEIKGEVTYVADIAWPLPPKPWWRRAFDGVIEFAVMDIGVIYIETSGAALIVIAVATMFVVLVRRRIRAGTR
jgi:hypothetical protein